MSALTIVTLSVAYGAGMVLVTCRLAALLAYHWMEKWNDEWVRNRTYKSSFVEKSVPSGEQWFGAAATALCAAIVWPLALVAYAARGVLFRPPEAVVAKRQAEYIAELERELRIGEVA